MWTIRSASNTIPDGGPATGRTKPDERILSIMWPMQIVGRMAMWRTQTRATIRGFSISINNCGARLRQTECATLEGEVLRCIYYHRLLSSTYPDEDIVMRMGWSKRWGHGKEMHIVNPMTGGPTMQLVPFSCCNPSTTQVMRMQCPIAKRTLPEMSIDPPTHPFPASLYTRQHTIASPSLNFYFFLLMYYFLNRG